MLLIFVIVGVVVLGTASSQKNDFKCPHEYGFYPHSNSCDKYWKCESNNAELKTCGNGLAFEASDPKYLAENCDYLHNVDCGDRVTLEPPQATANCPRLYGIFPDEERCDTFWSCWNGEASRYNCAPGLAYDPEARVCMWADQVAGCKVGQKEGDFNCPDQKNNPNPGTFSRHAHPEDCRKYYVCLDGNPREYGCPIGTVYKIGSDEFSGQCEDPEGVEGCQNYYGDELKGLKKSQLLGGLDDGSYKSSSSVTNKPTLRKKVKQVAKEVVVVPQQQQQINRPTRVNNQLNHRNNNNNNQQEIKRPQQQQQTTQSPPQQQTTPKPTSRAVVVTTTTAGKAQDEEYYYYDEYETPAANSNNKKQ